MAILPIITIPDPILRKEAAPIELVDETLRRLVDDMLATMYEAPGIGLAAPQVGIAKNMAIVRVPGSGGDNQNVDLVNCRIEKGFDERYFNKEGCLSFPGEYVRTRRFNEILVVDNAVEPHRFTATGLFAVCIQHELDHLRGVLLPDLAL